MLWFARNPKENKTGLYGISQSKKNEGVDQGSERSPEKSPTPPAVDGRAATVHRHVGSSRAPGKLDPVRACGRQAGDASDAGEAQGGHRPRHTLILPHGRTAASTRGNS